MREDSTGPMYYEIDDGGEISPVSDPGFNSSNRADEPTSDAVLQTSTTPLYMNSQANASKVTSTDSYVQAKPQSKPKLVKQLSVRSSDMMDEESSKPKLEEKQSAVSQIVMEDNEAYERSKPKLEEKQYAVSQIVMEDNEAYERSKPKLEEKQSAVSQIVMEDNEAYERSKPKLEEKQSAVSQIVMEDNEAYERSKPKLEEKQSVMSQIVMEDNEAYERSKDDDDEQIDSSSKPPKDTSDHMKTNVLEDSSVADSDVVMEDNDLYGSTNTAEPHGQKSQRGRVNDGYETVTITDLPLNEGKPLKDVQVDVGDGLVITENQQA